MPKFAAIIVAAGKGERFADKENKIFTKLGDQAVFLKAVQLFCNREDVCQTILVVAKDDMEKMKTQYGANIGFMGVQLIEGGAERHESVAKGLAAVSDEAEFVAVHDAVRVCLAEQWIDAIFESAARFGSAVPITPITATIKRIGEDNVVGDTVPREGLYLAQTPQVFRRKMIVEAYAKLTAGEILGGQKPTDDAQVVQAAGMDATAIDGDPRNVKITTQGDLVLAGAILKTLPAKPASRRGAFEEAQW
ncbi:MAG TPA: 2-C-methyl-D-erythritol 4-phosphate cytidylyltransferase [Phycisphaerae bacterium]|nr:2-C-methyl-D-erythritol 4-phosphate cytidylyltransferase [Phycisphaerae bacterium]